MINKAIVIADEGTGLLPVANRPLVAHALDGLSSAGIDKAMVAVGSSARDRVEAELGNCGPFEVDVSCLEHNGTGGLPAAFAGLGEFARNEPFVLHFADSLNHDGLDSLLDAPASELGSTVLVQDHVPNDRVVDLAGRRRGCGIGQADRAAAGVWLFGAGAWDVLSTVDTSGSAEADVARAIRTLADLGGHISVRQVEDWWRFHQAPDVLLEANRFALEGLGALPVEAQMIAARIQGAVAIHPSARVESSIVRGPAVIAAGVHLREAYVGPYTSIGEDVFIEGAEVENSVILAGASVTHLGGRLEASVVGPRARIFRDFRLPRAMRLNVGEDAEVSLA